LNRRLTLPEEYPVVLFLDELFARMHATRRRMWAPRGLYPRLPSWDHHGKWTVYGAVELRSGALFWHTARKWNNEVLREFLEQLAKHYAGQRLLIVWHNASIHLAKAVNQWLAEHPQVEVYRLPPYCAALDPVEDLWNQLRRHVTDNHLCQSLEELLSLILKWLRDWAARPQELLRLLGIDPEQPLLKLQQPAFACEGPEGLRLYPP